MNQSGSMSSDFNLEGKASAASKVRSSNIELYRIITMFLIVLHHYVVNSGLLSENVIYSAPMSWKSLVLLIFGAWGKTGINCFVLITGYFMCKSKITPQKFIKLLGEVLFYNIIIWLIFTISGYQQFSISALLTAIFPFHKIDTDFTSCYLLFYLFIPFLNCLIHHMTERQHIALLALCGFIYVVIGTFHRTTMNYISWFMIIYLIASYIRMYPKPVFDQSHKRMWGLITLACLLLSVISVIAGEWLMQKMGHFGPYYFVTDANGLLPVLTSVSSFLYFRSLNIKPNRWINSIAASTFGVLLIHANCDAMRKWLWQDVLNNVGAYASSLVILHALGSAILVFAVCIVIDKLRILTIEKPFLKAMDGAVKKVAGRFAAR